MTSSARVVSYSASTVKLAVDSSCDGLVVLGDEYYPGWSATVNGSDARIFATDVALRGVFVRAGHSIVEFRYRPSAFRVGRRARVARCARGGAVPRRARLRRAATPVAGERGGSVTQAPELEASPPTVRTRLAPQRRRVSDAGGLVVVGLVMLIGCSEVPLAGKTFDTSVPLWSPRPAAWARRSPGTSRAACSTAAARGADPAHRGVPLPAVVVPGGRRDLGDRACWRCSGYSSGCRSLDSMIAANNDDGPARSASTRVSRPRVPPL